MPDSVTIRHALPSDAATVVALIHHLLAELDGSSTGLSAQQELALMRNLLEPGQTRATLLAEADGRAVGLIDLDRAAALHAGGYYGVVQDLYVEPALRSSGVGRQLMEAAVEIARQRGWTRLELTTSDDYVSNDRTVGFYGRENFTRIGPRLKRHLG